MAERTIHLKRTSLYASGASPVNMIQAVFYNEDMLIYDLEDSVPASEKDAARFLVYNMLKEHRPIDKYVSILMRLTRICRPRCGQDQTLSVFRK
mgnify:CR=1 FL=1